MNTPSTTSSYLEPNPSTMNQTEDTSVDGERDEQNGEAQGPDFETHSGMYREAYDYFPTRTRPTTKPNVRLKPRIPQLWHRLKHPTQ